jgi:hypothetical protein
LLDHHDPIWAGQASGNSKHPLACLVTVFRRDICFRVLTDPSCELEFLCLHVRFAKPDAPLLLRVAMGDQPTLVADNEHVAVRTNMDAVDQTPELLQ